MDALHFQVPFHIIVLTHGAGQVAAALGAKVTVSDLEEEIPFVTNNICRNSNIHYSQITVVPLDWDEVVHEKSFPSYLNPLDFDLVICSDVVYELTLQALLGTIVLLFYHNPQILILMSNTDRKQVHLFRRKIECICIVEDTSHPNCYASNNINWIIKLKGDPQWEKIGFIT